MRPLRSLLFYALAVFVGGALAGPWLYWLAQTVAETWPQWRDLGDKPLHRYVLRSMMLIALAGLWPLLRSLGARSWTEMGLNPWRGQWPRLGAGLGLGFASLAGVAALALACGARELDGGVTGTWWRRLPGIAATAIVIGTLEELLYRGALYGGLRRVYGWRIALVASSAIYAAAHFLRRGESPAEIHWWSGLAQLPQMAAGFTRPDVLLPDFLVLLVAGLVLALAYERSGNLYFSIGLHIGWVFWLRSYNLMTDRRPDTIEWFWGTGRLYDGWLAFIALTVSGFIVWKHAQPRTKPHSQSQPLETNGRQTA